MTNNKIDRIANALTDVVVFLEENNIEEKKEIELAIQKLQEAVFWLDMSIEDQENE